MHDIRKPYTRSNYNSRDLQSRVEQFEARTYEDDVDNGRREYNNEPVQIPTRRTRRDISRMDMYPRRRSTDVYEDDRRDIRDDYEEDLPPRLPKYPDQRTRRPRGERSIGTWVFIITVLTLSIGAALLTYVFDSATITIIPKYKDINDYRKTILFTQGGTDISGIPFTVATSSVSKLRHISTKTN
jgi:hypothetical protein